MKVWKKAVSAALCICLAASLFTGFSLTDVAAAEYGTLQNGALTENTTGWTVAGDMSLAETGSETAGYWNTTESGTSYLSIWNSGDDRRGKSHQWKIRFQCRRYCLRKNQSTAW